MRSTILHVCMMAIFTMLFSSMVCCQEKSLEYIVEETLLAEKVRLASATVSTIDGRHVLLVWTDKGSFMVIEGKVNRADDQQAGVITRHIYPHIYRETAPAPLKRGRKWVMVVDGQSGPEYDEIKDRSVSQVGKRIAYSARNGKKWRVVLDGQPGPEYDSVGQLTFSADGNRFAYRVTNGKKRYIVLDGQPGPEYYDVGQLTFSADGNRFAYAASTGRKLLVVTDGQPGQEYGMEITDLVFSPDGKRLAYRACDAPSLKKWSNNQYVVVDGQPGPGFELVTVGSVTFSPDGSRIAYIAGESNIEQRVVVDGQAGRKYETVLEGSIVFSPDGKRVAYWVGGHLEPLSPVVDGQRGPGYYEYVLKSTSFLPDGSVGYLAKKKTPLLSNVGSLYYIKLTMQPAPESESSDK